MFVAIKQSMVGLLLALCLVVPAAAPAANDAPPAQEQAKRQVEQPYNNAPVWREVRSGEPGITQVRGRETAVLINSQGQTWRQIRNGPITLYGGTLVVAVLVAIGLYYRSKGAMKLHAAPSGRALQRFSAWDRLIHWAVAISFSVLAISGLIMLFGKHVLLPVFGYTLFSWLAQLCIALHNFIGPLFLFCVVAFFFTFVKDNFFKAHDGVWFRKMGGMLSGEHVPSGKFNGGEKVWFWLGVALLGMVVSASGLVLDFPNFDQTRNTMQLANIIHATGALIYVSAALGHIYMGTIGMEGAFQGMRTGYVDETWAKEHHELWYGAIKSGQTTQPGASPGTHVHA